MKKTLLVIMAALSMLLTQCKKSEAESPSDGKPVNITLNVGGNSKINVNPGTGEVKFSNGDKIYVASGGVYVGELIYNNSMFSGTITDPTEGEPLQFYFLGNKIQDEGLTEGTTSELTINISDQSSELPVISYAPSDEDYSSSVTSYKAFLLNKCALVKFNVSSYTGSGTVGIKGMNNQVTVALNDNSFNYGKINDGEITLNKNNNEYWAILLPQAAVEGGGEAYSSDGWSGTYGNVPAITINGYLTNGIAVNLMAPLRPFTVADGKTVEFSPGNLYYDGSSWHFEAHQWDYRTYQGLGACIDGETTTTQQGHWGLFGWSTNHTDAFWGMDISITDNNYSDTFVDWGTNVIGTDAAGTWRTLSLEEWSYLLKTRTNATKLCTVKFLDDELHKGLVILPDGTNSSVMDKITTTADLATYGAVFLPIAGQRKGTKLLNETTGYYWTSTFYPNTSRASIGANYLSFSKINYISISIANWSWAARYMGLSVRLVRDCAK